MADDFEDRQFDEAVKVLSGPDGFAVKHIASNNQAARMLLFEWPTRGGKKHLAARRACMEVMQGLKSAAAARKAFAEAAKEADILVTKGFLTKDQIR